MAKRNHVNAEHAHFMRLLELSDNCAEQLRSALADAMELAEQNAPNAFALLSALCKQLGEFAKTSRTNPKGNPRLDEGVRLPSAIALCFKYRDSSELVRKLAAAARKASGWQPVEVQTEKRPSIVLGDRKRAVEQWKKDAATEQNRPDRIAERKQRQSILRAMDSVFVALSIHQAAIRDQLVPKEKTVGKSKGWTQQDLDDNIRNLRTGATRKIESLRKAISCGDNSAKREARNLYGRNSLAKRYAAPPAMVSYSVEWQKLADYLSLRSGSHGAQASKVGYDIAIEQSSVEGHARSESVERVWDHLAELIPSDLARIIRDQVAKGEITEKQAHDAIGEYVAKNSGKCESSDQS